MSSLAGLEHVPSHPYNTPEQMAVEILLIKTEEKKKKSHCNVKYCNTTVNTVILGFTTI